MLFRRLSRILCQASFQPQYAPATESTCTTSIAACAAKLSLSGQIQQLVDAGLITLDGESDEEPVGR